MDWILIGGPARRSASRITPISSLAIIASVSVRQIITASGTSMVPGLRSHLRRIFGRDARFIFCVARW